MALLIALLGLVISGMRQTPPANLDYLIVLGARVNPDGNPSPALQNRLNAAIDYLAANPETIAIASGGQGADEPVSEATCIRDALVAAGVDPDRILVEDQSTSTAENLTFSLALMAVSYTHLGAVIDHVVSHDGVLPERGHDGKEHERSCNQPQHSARGEPALSGDFHGISS